jgi:hypothetical protein
MGIFEKFMDAAEKKADKFADRQEDLADQAGYSFDSLQRAESVNDVKDVFQELETLDAKTRKKVVSRIEQLLIEDNTEFVKEAKEELANSPESLEEALKEPGTAENEKYAEIQLSTFQHVRQILGDKAHPFTKAVAEKLEEMPSEDRQSDAKVALLVIEAHDQAQGSPKNLVSEGVRNAKSLITKGILGFSSRG